MKNKRLLYYGLALVLTSNSTYSQTNSEALNRDNELPKEIVVTEGLSAYQIRKQIQEAEEGVYELFNALNDDRRFEISCSTSDRANSHFSFRSCAPEFEIQATRSQAQAHFQEFRSYFANPGELSPGNAPSSAALPTQIIIDRHQAEYKAKMKEMAENNPEFLNALVNYVEMKEKYTQNYFNDEN